MDALSNGKKAPYGPATITVEKHKDYFMTQHGTLHYLWYWLKKWLDFRSPWSWTNSWWIKRYLNNSFPQSTDTGSSKKCAVTEKVATTAGNLSSLDFDGTFNGTLLSHSKRKNGFPQSTDTGSSKKSAVTEKDATNTGHLSSFNNATGTKGTDNYVPEVLKAKSNLETQKHINQFHTIPTLARGPGAEQ